MSWFKPLPNSGCKICGFSVKPDECVEVFGGLCHADCLEGYFLENEDSEQDMEKS